MASNRSLVRPYRAPVCPDGISRAQAEQYRNLGFVAFEGVLSDNEVAEANHALSDITKGLFNDAVEGKADLLQANPKASRNYAGVRVQKQNSPFGIHFEAGVDPLSLTPNEAELKYRKLYGYHEQHPALLTLADHPRIKGFLEQLIGQGLLLKGEMALSKPPMIGSEKPWHQDNAYFNWLPLHLVGTVWIALDDATIDNGCMFVLPGGHKLGALKHHHTIDCEILQDRFDRSEAVPVELKAGGALYFSAMLPHQTPPNRTQTRRRALQLQYRGVETVQVSKEEFGKVFAEADGTPASCALAYEDG